MSKGRRIHGEKELNELQRARETIKKLKRQISSLRSQLSRATSSERLADLQDLVARQIEEDKEQIKINKKYNKAKSRWECYTCGGGIMEIRLMNLPHGVYYSRKCSNLECDNKTAMKKYNPATVDGVVSEKDEE